MASPQLTYLAYHDALTGLANRRSLLDTLEGAVPAAAADGSSLALLFLDLNGFKLVNDSLGHAMGDELLREVGRRLGSAVRQGEVLGRLGGDEFVLLVPDVPEHGTQQAVEAIGHRLGDVLRAPFALGDVEVLVDAAVGASVYPADAGDPETLCKHADAAMYQAKATGSAVVLHSEATPDPLERLELAARLRRAIERDQLELHYQPILRLPEQEIMGVEALVRWRDPERGLIAPDAFIGVAESTGVIEALGDWVLEELCRQAVAWEAHGFTPNFGYNVSPRQLRRPGFAQSVAERVVRHGVAPGRIVCELTESAWSLEASRLMPVLQELRAAGLALAIDDFGAGYSSLWRLRELPVQIIKVDRSLLRGVPEDPQATAVISAILRLAEACGCDVVAEGVETVAQRDFLVAEGCRLAQGFVFARPQTADRIGVLLAHGLAGDRRGETAPAPVA